MGITDHIIKISLTSLIGFIISYGIYQYLYSINSYFAIFLRDGLILSIPISLIFIIYNKIKLAKYSFISIWFIYIIGKWIDNAINIFVTSPIYSWVSAIIIVGSSSLIIFLRRKGISFQQIFYKSKIENFKELEERISFDIETLSIIQCKILMKLIDSKKPCPKKELCEYTKATYPTFLKSINELKELGLIEIIELPRKAKGAPIFHAVKLSKNIINEKEKIKNLIEKRLKELEESKKFL
jgi:DNA-binding transcriptional ArsR family regulator